MNLETAKEIEKERQCLSRVRELIEQLAEQVGPIWHWGDGYGGHVKDLLRAAIESKGMSWQEPLREKKNSRPSISRRTREIVIARDGLVCTYCKCALMPEEVTLDHKRAFINGGTEDPENLTIACRSCNSSKGALSAEDFVGTE